MLHREVFFCFENVKFGFPVCFFTPRGVKKAEKEAAAQEDISATSSISSAAASTNNEVAFIDP
jgi:hypothetical protein